MMSMMSQAQSANVWSYVSVDNIRYLGTGGARLVGDRQQVPLQSPLRGGRRIRAGHEPAAGRLQQPGAQLQMVAQPACYEHLRMITRCKSQPRASAFQHYGLCSEHDLRIGTVKYMASGRDVICLGFPGPASESHTNASLLSWTKTVAGGSALCRASRTSSRLAAGRVPIMRTCKYATELNILTSQKKASSLSGYFPLRCVSDMHGRQQAWPPRTSVMDARMVL